MAKPKNEDNNRIPDLLDVLSDLKKYHVEVGIFGDEDEHMVMIAQVNEFGADIRPKNANHLTIPFPEAGDKSAGDFGDELFRPRNTDILAVKNGQNDLTPMFALVDHVSIPERSYMRTTYNEQQDQLAENIEKSLDAVIRFKIKPKDMYERIGVFLQGKIQDKIGGIRTPANADATVANKGSSNPLIDTGRLRQSITWRVVKDQ